MSLLYLVVLKVNEPIQKCAMLACVHKPLQIHRGCMMHCHDGCFASTFQQDFQQVVFRSSQATQRGVRKKEPLMLQNCDRATDVV